MGLIQAALSAAGTVLGDQWKEFFYCEAIDNNTLVVKGQKKVSGFSSNRRGADNIISKGSVVAVADGQCMVIVDNGKIAELCAVPGEFVYDSSTEPSIFAGDLVRPPRISGCIISIPKSWWATSTAPPPPCPSG